MATKLKEPGAQAPGASGASVVAHDGGGTATVAEFSIPADLDYQDVLATARDHFFALDPNIVGVGIGPRRVGGKIEHDKMALVIYVMEKKPIEQVRPEAVIPETFMGLGTDVHPPFSAAAPTTTVSFVSEHEIGDDMANLDWVRVHEFTTAAAAPPTLAHGVLVQDFGDVCVVQNDGTVVGTAPDGTQYVDFVRAYQLFRTLHGDDYDFVTFFVDTASDMPSVCGCSFWSGIFNNVTGIGLGAFNGRPGWGTARLQGFHFLNQGHFPIWRYVMLQEFCHQFAAFARYRDPATSATMTDHLLGGVLGHWSGELDDDKSPMGYDSHNWVELPSGRFQRVSLTSDERVYSNLDLYLMGLLGANEVGEFTQLRGVTPVPGTTDQVTATPVRLNVGHFIAQEGGRTPSVSTAPKFWREAFIVLTNDIHRVHDLVDGVDGLRQRWEGDFLAATKGLGRVDTVLGQRPGRLTPAQIAELTSGGYTTLHRHVVGPNDLQITGTQWTGTINPGQVQNWFTFNWPTSWFVTWSIRPTTSGGKITWDVSIERAANNTFTYWIRVTNTGTVATQFEGQYARLR